MQESRGLSDVSDNLYAIIDRNNAQKQSSQRQGQ